MHRASDEIIIDIDFHKESVRLGGDEGKREDASSVFRAFGGLTLV